MKYITSMLTILALAFIVNIGHAEASSNLIGEAKSKGIFMKDTISVYAEDDPDYPNITCYTTQIEIGGPNLSNPSDSSIACRLINSFDPEKIEEKKIILQDRKEVFAHSKNFFFKELVIDRFYDAKRNVLVYLAYTKNMTGTNASHSISVVPLSMDLSEVTSF